MAPASSSAERTRRIPRPPPPAEALTSSGNPREAASSTGHQGNEGTPRSPTSLRAASLSPIAAMQTEGGPTQVNPEAATAPANAAFSDKNP